MFAPADHAAKRDFAACSGCSLCLLVCPVWRRTRDVRLTPHGRAKALQHGAAVADIAASIESCTLCGACEPVCPENIDLVAMLADLRSQLPRAAVWQDRGGNQAARPLTPPQAASTTVLLPGQALREHPTTLARIEALLWRASELHTGTDDGADLALALEIGAPIPAPRRERFLDGLREFGTIIVADGLLLRHLRTWLPRAHCMSLGEALSALPCVRRGLRADDLYVIEPRAYHADYARLVKYYDRLRIEAGCAFNLDLQRIAVPATVRSLRQRLGLAAPDDLEQVRWILKGRTLSRIVVENMEDGAAFVSATHVPVVQLAEVADD